MLDRILTPPIEVEKVKCVVSCGYKERLSNLYHHYNKYLEGKKADNIHTTSAKNPAVQKVMTEVLYF